MFGIKQLEHGKDLPLPSYQTRNSAGMDLYAATGGFVLPGERVLVPTGISIELPPEYEAQVRPRSGLALKHGVTVLNTPGTIDADYRGEIGVLLINHDKENTFHFKREDRIAQLVISSVKKIDWVVKEDLTNTNRGEGGFGSTG